MDEKMVLSEQKGGYSNLNRLLLVLFLADLQLQPAAGHKLQQSSKGVSISIVGPDYVTVGVPSSVECVGSCPACSYSMSLGGQSAQGQGNMLTFTVNRWVEALTVACTATDDKTNVATSKTKTLQVLAGPANVTITGPDLVNATRSYIYICHAYCQPSCTYTWKTTNGPWIDGQGNLISVTLQNMNSPEVLVCKATNNVSRLFVSATQEITVIGSASPLFTRPGETLTMLLLTFISSAAFIL